MPKAVASTCPIFATYIYGNLRTHRKNIIAIVPKPCIINPNMTVPKYKPKLSTVSPNDLISITLAVIRKNTPSGDILKINK